MPSYATKELEKASLGDGSSGVVGKTNNETNKLIVGLWKTSQNRGGILPQKTIDWIDMNKETRNLFHWEDK